MGPDDDDNRNPGPMDIDRGLSRQPRGDEGRDLPLPRGEPIDQGQELPRDAESQDARRRIDQLELDSISPAAPQGAIEYLEPARAFQLGKCRLGLRADSRAVRTRD